MTNSQKFLFCLTQLFIPLTYFCAKNDATGEAVICAIFWALINLFLYSVVYGKDSNN